MCSIFSYLQHGSIPVINPLNESFPDRFNLRRSFLTLLVVSSNKTSLHHEITHPLPGVWFAAAFLGDYVDDSITVKVSSQLSIICNCLLPSLLRRQLGRGIGVRC